jgi:hypothetical protein
MRISVDDGRLEVVPALVMSGQLVTASITQAAGARVGSVVIDAFDQGPAHSRPVVGPTFWMPAGGAAYASVLARRVSVPRVKTVA